MEQNNNIQNNTGTEYSFPHNKEQFKQVLKQAQEGQYMRSEPDERPQPSRKFVQDNNLPREHAERTETTQNSADERKKTESFDYFQPAFSNRLTPIKKKLNPLVIVLPLILVIIAAAAVIFFFLYNNITYRKAEENYFGGLMQNCLELKNSFFKDKSPVKADITFSVPAAGMIGIDASEAAFTADTVKEGDKFYTAVSAAVGKESFTAESWADFENKTFAVLFPEISDIYLCLNDFADYTEIFNDIIVKTSDVYFELVGEPEPEKNTVFTVKDSSFKADRYVIHLDGVQLAALERSLLVNILSNDEAAAVLCRVTGCETKEELVEDEKMKAVFNELEQIITGEKKNTACLDMNVYVRDKTVIGREIIFTGTDGEGTNAADPSDTDTADRTILNIYEIPDGNQTLTHIYFVNPEKNEIYIKGTRTLARKNVYSGKTTFSYGENTLTVNYTDLAVTEGLFQGKISAVSESSPALAATAELKTDGDKKLFNLSVPNIVNIDATITPSEIVYKEMPEIFEGEYAELPFDNGNKSETTEKFKGDFSEFIGKLMNPRLNNDKEGNTNDGDSTGSHAAGSNEKDTSNETGILIDPTDKEPDETAPDVTEPPVSDPDIQENTQETEAPPISETAPETAAPITTPSAVYYAPSTLDTGNSQKIRSAGLDSFNSGNYYTAEIYVDSAFDASGNVAVSELSGHFDGYIKGKVLQIDFAEGYDFDSALVVLTFPYGTVSGGRHYPYSDTLKGLDRYLVLGSENGEEYGDSEIKCYKYSANQIGFIIDKSGYYYVVDLDSYFFEEIGAAPESPVIPQ